MWTRGGKPLEQVDTYKYLRLVLDKHLNYSECLEDIIWKYTTKSGRYPRLGTTWQNTWPSIVAPYFDYGDIIFMGESSM